MENRAGEKQSKGINGWLILMVAIIIASIISWLLVTNLAAPKSDYAAEITRINNSLSHMKDSATSLDKFTGYQSSRIDDLTDSTQTKFDEIDGSFKEVDSKITTANNKINETQGNLTGLNTQVDAVATQTTQINSQLTTVTQEADTTKTALDTLTTQVNNQTNGVQISPTESSGSITLNIKSDTSRTVAFQIVFRPTSDMPQTATMDSALSALYSAPPVTLTAGSSVRGDYTLFWSTSDSKYHLGQISFITMGTALTTGSQTKSISYTASSGTYEVLVSVEYPTGAYSTGTW
jgi:hypothetical protein